MDEWATPTDEERDRHRLLLGAAVLGRMANDHFGFSGRHAIAADILDMIDIAPAGEEDGQPIFTDEQQEYAHLLYDDLGGVWTVAAKCLRDMADRDA